MAATSVAEAAILAACHAEHGHVLHAEHGHPGRLGLAATSVAEAAIQAACHADFTPSTAGGFTARLDILPTLPWRASARWC